MSKSSRENNQRNPTVGSCSDREESGVPSLGSSLLNKRNRLSRKLENNMLGV